MTKDTDTVQIEKDGALKVFQHDEVRRNLGMSHVESKLMDIRLAMAMNIRRLRTRANVPKEALAEKLHLSTEDIHAMEHASAKIDFETYFKTLIALGFNPNPFTTLVD